MMKPLMQLCSLMKLRHWKSVSKLSTRAKLGKSELPNLALVAPIKLPNVTSTKTAATKLKAIVTKEPLQSNDAVLPAVDEYLCLKSAPKILEKISRRPKIPVLRQRKRKTESAENLTSSPFKKRLEEHENNIKEKQQAVILRKEKLHLIR